jgi:hypothetical protein
MMFGHEINLPVDLVLGRPFQEKVYENAPDYVRDLENIVDKVHVFARSHMNMSSDVMKKTYDPTAKFISCPTIMRQWVTPVVS